MVDVRSVMPKVLGTSLVSFGVDTPLVVSAPRDSPCALKSKHVQKPHF